MSFLKHAGTGFAVTALSLRAQQGFAQAGGRTLFLSAGNYLCYSIRLKSNIAFYLDQGATIVAARAAVHQRPVKHTMRQNPTNGTNIRTSATATGITASSGRKAPRTLPSPAQDVYGERA